MRIRIPKDGLIGIDDCRGMLLRCEEGALWMTQAGDPEDHLLGPRQEMIVRQGGRLVVEARRDACLLLVIPPRCRPVPGM